jgi:hypothetical protein
MIMFLAGVILSYRLAMKLSWIQSKVNWFMNTKLYKQSIGRIANKVREIATDKMALVMKKMSLKVTRNQYAWSWKSIGANAKLMAIKVKDIALEKVQSAGKIISMGIDKARKAAAAAYLVIQNLSIGSTIRETAAMVWKNTLMVFSTAATWAATAAQWALNVAMAANPIGLIILGVIALVAVIVLLFKKFNLFPKIIGGVMKVFSVFKTAVMTALKFAFAPLFIAYEVFKKVKGFIGKLFGGGGDKSKAAAGAPAPEMHSGGMVTGTGAAQVQKGEAVLTEQQQGSMMSTQAMESKLDQLIQLMGQQGPIALGVNQTKVNTARVADSIV